MSSSSPIITPYVNKVYAFEASGGFQMLRNFDDITLRQQLLLDTYDVTNSVQIMLDVAWFNSNLGIYKNATNDALVSSSFDKVKDEFTYADGVQADSIIFSANDLRECLVTHKQIISVGAFLPLYTNFTSYVRYYFGFHGGFSSLFEGASEFAVDPSNNNVFNSESIFKLIHGETEISNGGVIKDLTGYVRIGDITQSLRTAVDTNCFGNRTPTIIDESGIIVEGSGTAVDPVNKSNYGVNDGFVAGDLIFVPTGFAITLNVKVQSETLQGINNTTPTPFRPIRTTVFTGEYTSDSTLSTRTLIDRKSKAPLLIKLVNASTIAAL